MKYTNSQPKRQWRWWFAYRRQPLSQPSSLRFLGSDKSFPKMVRCCPITMRAVQWLRLFDWSDLAQPSKRQWFGRSPVPITSYIAAFLLKLDQGLSTTAQLRRFLVAHPPLVWALGFPLLPGKSAYGFDATASLPSARHFNRVLRQLPNAYLQSLLDRQVTQLQSLLPDTFGQRVSLDTKHILAWAKENNPKAYIKEGRYDPNRAVAGDPDCKLGCKRRHNAVTHAKEGESITGQKSLKEFYWGYASGAVVTKVKGVGEFVLAEMTKTLNDGDVTYFFPLMAQVERRLGFKPTYGLMDKAYDAFYVYEYFHNPAGDGAAIVPFNRANGDPRPFDPDGLPLCQAGLPMPVRKTYTDRTKAIVPHQRAFHACPLLFPQPTGELCPIQHKQWSKGGCTVQLPTSIGTRIRHQLDRESDWFKEIYKERTAVERIFSQAHALGIERPKLRNQQAIANQNTLTYLLINVRAIERFLQSSSHSK